MSTRVKICGITSVEDASAAVEAGADALGFVFAESPRRITPQAARSILLSLPPFITCVGLFVNQDPLPVLEICPLDVVQFHGDESPEFARRCGRRWIKVFRIGRTEDLDARDAYPDASAHLLDAFHPAARGGTGTCIDPALLQGRVRPHPPVILAGGLTPENVAAAVGALRPYGVDVSSGVESAPGRKDALKMRRFVDAVREAQNSSSRPGQQRPDHR